MKDYERFKKPTEAFMEVFMETSKKLWKLLANYNRLWNLLEAFGSFYERFLKLYNYNIV